MKKFVLILFVAALISCQSDDDIRRNPFLVDISFQVVLNTDLPQNSDLNFDSNSIIVPNQGLRGIVIYRVNQSQYFAYELSDPNHSPNDCSMMTVEGITATCGCPDDSNSYNIVTGAHDTDPEKFPMKPYRVSRSGNNVIVSN